MIERPRRKTALLLISVIAAAVTVSGCSVAARPAATIATGAVIDGFTLGVPLHCSGPVGPVTSAAIDRACSGDPQRAIAALDARDPSHAAIVSTTSWTDGGQPGAIDVTGDSPPPTGGATQSGANVTVFVFRLADGSMRATGVACSDAGPCVGVGSHPG